MKKRSEKEKLSIVETFSEEIWNLGQRRRVTLGMWGAVIIAIQANVIANWMREVKKGRRK